LKLNYILVFLLILLLSSNVEAVADNSLVFDLEPQDANSMTWPMLPGESVNDIARLFYPKNKTKQQQFVFKTLRLSANIRPDLRATERFESPTLLMIPTPKSLSNDTHAIQHGRNKVRTQKLIMSYSLEQVPAKLMKDYELLLSRNAFLKEELAKLNEKLVFLQTKLDELKLILDKTLTPPNNGSSAKKIFKNLNQPANVSELAKVPEHPDKDSLLNIINNNLFTTIFILCLLTVLCVYLFKKYQRHMLSKMSFVATKMQATVADLGGFWQATKQVVGIESKPEPTISKEGEVRLDATLEEAKLLMSINRATDAIAHLKMTIEAQPKATINHWLYLLDIFKKLNLKEDFEKYATNLHSTFNVMTPIWQDTEIAMVVSQSLEEFPHIMEKLYSTWPDDTATIYLLRGLITDNRGGERTGFGKKVLSEILFLIALLEIRKTIN
jgi:hypothetical protein